jgi:hypothetical protein
MHSALAAIDAPLQIGRPEKGARRNAASEEHRADVCGEYQGKGYGGVYVSGDPFRGNEREPRTEVPNCNPDLGLYCSIDRHGMSVLTPESTPIKQPASITSASIRRTNDRQFMIPPQTPYQRNSKQIHHCL